MQHSVDKFPTASRTNFGLTTSTKKTEVLQHSAPGKPYVEPNITVTGQRLYALNKFTCLGSTPCQNVIIGDEIKVRIGKASIYLRQTTSAAEKSLVHR